MLLNNSQADLQIQLSQLSVLQNQSSSGQAISKPSDNPSGMALSLALQSQQSANTQYAANATDGQNWLTSVDGALTSATTALQQVRNLTLSAANATQSTTSQNAIVSQLESLKGELMSAANTTYLGRPVFAGNSDSGAAFNSDYSYNGTPGQTVTRTISPDTTVSVSGDGAATFGTGSNSVFALIDNIVGDIQSGSDVTGQVANIDSALSAVSSQTALVGANYNVVQAGQAVLTTQASTLTTQRSDVDSVDITKTVIALQSQQVAYQAALDVTSKALQPTLISLLS
ncbi:MAG: flagellar hook-associated protein 3 FlgL [Actinomycetota bacterium]|jgi:flagellar hook-associated protein 3 FlgL|nr:flagellar hook-associated protein 3 FlgL [Actinomycetota bacterium]MDQ1561404.1 flagellar hook-associated protein 3 FlgL [Actinomycetota bacterium]